MSRLLDLLTILINSLWNKANRNCIIFSNFGNNNKKIILHIYVQKKIYNICIQYLHICNFHRDIINDSDDVFILRRCLKILTKMLTTNNVDIQIVSLAETIISKIMSSNNSFVRDSIGHYYMYYEKVIYKIF